MTANAPHDEQMKRVATISEALIAQFGHRAQDIAKQQADAAYDGVAQTWTKIVAYICMLSSPDADRS